MTLDFFHHGSDHSVLGGRDLYSGWEHAFFDCSASSQTLTPGLTECLTHCSSIRCGSVQSSHFTSEKDCSVLMHTMECVVLHIPQCVIHCFCMHSKQLTGMMDYWPLTDFFTVHLHATPCGTVARFGRR